MFPVATEAQLYVPKDIRTGPMENGLLVIVEEKAIVDLL
jgi:hypothetical protein